MTLFSKNKFTTLGKPIWNSLLNYMIDLHEGSFHAPLMDLLYRWEEIAPQSGFNPVFGHWDTVHIACDGLVLNPKQAIHQILNNLALQQPNGLIPGYIRIVNNELAWSPKMTCPPLWPVIVHDYFGLTEDLEILKKCYLILEKQISWFECERQAQEIGFYYLDYLDCFWESGVEEGIRYEFGDDLPQKMACVDATSHVCLLYDHAWKWAKILNLPCEKWEEKWNSLVSFIQLELFDEETGFFHDQWTVDNSHVRKLAFEGFWPLVIGAATTQQAQRVINENLLNSSRFFTPHPISTVAKEDPLYENHHWKGPTRNSMTYWAARGCVKYCRFDAAEALLENALDATNLIFQSTGKIWEFYHPEKGNFKELSRLKGNPQQGPFPNYLGHNPLIAMIQLWEQVKDYRPRTNA